MTRINCYEKGIVWVEQKFKEIKNAIINFDVQIQLLISDSSLDLTNLEISFGIKHLFILYCYSDFSEFTPNS